MNCFQIKVQEDQREMLLTALNDIRENKGIDFEILEITPTTQHTTQQETGEEVNDGGGSRDEAVMEIRKDLVEDLVETPSEIANGVAKWLDHNGVARAEFAKYINRSKSHVTDMLKRPPLTLPKGAGREVWIKMQTFLTNISDRNSFLESQLAMKGERKRATTTRPTTSTTTPPKKRKQTPASRARTKLYKWQKVMLDEIFVKCDGRPLAETVQRISPILQLDKRQVSSPTSVTSNNTIGTRRNAPLINASI